MPGMSRFGQPGQRNFRSLNLRDEIRRINQTSFLMAVYGSLFLLLLLAGAIVVGPVLGVVIGSAILAWVLCRYVYPFFLQVGVQASWARLAFALNLMILETFWAIGGYTILDIYWIPIRLSWDPYLKVLAVFIIILLKLVCFSAIRSAFIEQVDPDGPTAPRMAIARDKAVLPWHLETHGGTVFEEPETIVSPPPLVRISVERNGAGPAVVQRADIPATPSWRSFSTAVVSGAAKFTESDAKRFGISPVNKMNGGKVILPGFRSVRDIFHSQGWGHWKDPSAHTMGFVVDPDGVAVLEGIANVS